MELNDHAQGFLANLLVEQEESGEPWVEIIEITPEMAKKILED